MMVWSPIGSASTSSYMQAMRSASQASSCVAQGAVMVMLWKMSPVKSLPFCRQEPMHRRSWPLSALARS